MGVSRLVQKASAAERHGGGSGVVREARAALNMMRSAGIGATVSHIRAIAMVRLDRVLFDRKFDACLPRPLRGELPPEAEIACVEATEADAAVTHSPVPALAFRLALRGVGIAPADYHFIDIGSGRGAAVLRAAMLPFRSVTGVEFARAYHEDAVANLDWAREHNLIKAQKVDLLHQSALDLELPEGDCLLFLYSPFEEVVMLPFLDRIDRLVRERPRRLLAIYVNPVARAAFARPGVSEISLKPVERTLLRLLAPHEVRAFAWAAPTRG